LICEKIKFKMAASINVSIEPLDEYHVQEISYDGQEKLIQPLTMSENLTKLVHKIDFSKPVDTVEEMMETDAVTNGAEDDKTDQKELASFQPSLWPWDSVRNKLKQSLTEISVLLDVIALSKNRQYLVLDPVHQEQSTYKPLSHLISKKQSLLNASNIILQSVNRLKLSQIDLNRTADFQSELKLLRQNWRLKKSGNIILGDLSYRNAGSRFPHSGTFEVIKNDLSSSSSSIHSSPNSSAQPQNVLDVLIPSDLEGTCYIHVSIHRDDRTLYESKLPTPNSNNEQSTANHQLNTISWQKKLENAQNVLFCKELFSHLAREAVQLQLPIPALVIGNKIIVTLFTGIQLVIGLCHSQTKNKKVIEDDFKPNEITEKEHQHVLEHSLHQLLREIHYQALHQPMPHPATATLGISKKRYFAGPDCTDRQTLIDCQKTETILEQITAQAQHMVLREQTMKTIDSLVLEVKDPLIVAHWLVLNTPTMSSVKLNIVSYGYESLNRTPLVIHVKVKSLVVIGRDGRKFNLSYEAEELRHLILSHISNHQMYALQSLSKVMAWKVVSFTSNCGVGPLEKSGTASSMSLSSPDGERLISVRFDSSNRPLVSISLNNEEENQELGSIVRDSKWLNIKKKFKEINLDKMEGRNFLNKMEILIASLTKP